MRYPQYKPGARWQVRRDDGPEFDVTVTSTGNKSNKKNCRVEFVGQWRSRHSDYETEFSTEHMKKYFTYQYTEVKCDWCDGAGKCVTLLTGPPPGEPHQQLLPCKKCSGTGKVKVTP